MRKHKNKIIAASVILAILAVAWLYGGTYNKNQGPGIGDREADGSRSASAHDTLSPGQTAENAAATDGAGGAAGASQPGSQDTTAPGNGAAAPSQGEAAGSPERTGRADPEGLPETAPDNAGQSSSEPTPIPDRQPGEAGTNGEERPMGGQSTAGGSTEQSEPGSDENPGASQDRYQTDPVPEGKPSPVEPEDAVSGDGSFTVYLAVRVDTILDNMDLLDKEKHELVPEDGVIFPRTAVTAYEGESVFNVFQREMRRARIHMVSRFTPIYNSAYIEAVNNLYEFDVGELSGWMYSVNGWYPNYGCSRYQLQPGDAIEWNYTCDLGRDLGQFWITGQ